MLRRRFQIARALCLLGLAACGCVVTDTIEFEDAENSPPQVISSTPRGLIVSTGPDGDLTFSVVVQDPDEQSAPEAEIEARLFASNAYFGEKVFACDPPREPPILVGISEGASEGAYIYLACTLRSWNLADIPAGVTTEVTLEVSDLGYTGESDPRADAHTVAVRWVLEVEQ